MRGREKTTCFSSPDLAEILCSSFSGKNLDIFTSGRSKKPRDAQVMRRSESSV